MDKYIVVVNDCLMRHEEEVNDKIKQGYELVGGVSAAERVMDTWYHQAMIKRGHE